MFNEKDFKDLSLTVHAELPSTKEVVLKGWPLAKEVIIHFQLCVKNPVVKFILQACIWIGDGLYTKFQSEV